MSINYPALKVELQTDPQSIGYSPLLAAGNHVGVSAAVNLPRATIIIRKDSLPAAEVFDAIVPGDFDGLNPNNRTKLGIILGMGTINVKGDNTRAQFNALFGPLTPTRAAILALIDRQGSRGEQLFGVGTIVGPADVAMALAT